MKSASARLVVSLPDTNVKRNVFDQLLKARKIAVLTGAGISAESGIPTFRGKDGLWNNYSATDLATPEAFNADPKLVWEWYAWRRKLISDSNPNAGHLALAEIERMTDDFTLMTQNVDGLHQRAGSRQIIELHGNIWRARCIGGCGTMELKELGEIPPRCSCGALLRPDIVWFGESLSRLAISRSSEAASRCDTFFVIGTSAVVFPAAELPLIAKQNGAFTIEINTERTSISSTCDASILGRAGDVLPEIASMLSSKHAHTKSL